MALNLAIFRPYFGYISGIFRVFLGISATSSAQRVGIWELFYEKFPIARNVEFSNIWPYFWVMFLGRVLEPLLGPGQGKGEARLSQRKHAKCTHAHVPTMHPCTCTHHAPMYTCTRVHRAPRLRCTCYPGHAPPSAVLSEAAWGSLLEISSIGVSRYRRLCYWHS